MLVQSRKISDIIIEVLAKRCQHRVVSYIAILSQGVSQDYRSRFGVFRFMKRIKSPGYRSVVQFLYILVNIKDLYSELKYLGSWIGAARSVLALRHYCMFLAEQL
jgi:hypothetical protein